jgi:hypothetical protein
MYIPGHFRNLITNIAKTNIMSFCTKSVSIIFLSVSIIFLSVSICGYK